MKLSKTLVLTALLASVSFAPVHADVFKSSEFLTWKESSQDFYIEASVGMAGFIAAQKGGAQKTSSCVDSWYYTDEPEKNAYIRDIMRKHSDYHPRAVILAVLEKKCGKF